MGDVGVSTIDVHVKSNAITGLFNQMSGVFVLFHPLKDNKGFRTEFLPDPSESDAGSLPLADIFPGNRAPEEIRGVLSKVLETSQTIHKVLPFSTSTSDILWADFTFSPFMDNLIIGVFRNVSGLVEMFQSYEANKKNLEQLQENVPIGLFQADPDGKFGFVNSWFAKILGFKGPNAMAKLCLRDIFIDEEQYDSVFEKLTCNKRLKETEVRLKNRSGEDIWAIISIQCVYNEKNKLENIDGYLYDITARKSALEELKDSEQMFRAISQSLSSALYMFDADGKFIYCNPVIHEITGYTVEEAMQRKFFDIVHPDFRSMVKERGLKRLEGKTVPKSYEAKILTKDKKEKWLEIHATRIVLKGKPVILGLANDITDRKLALDTIKRSEEKYKTLYSFFRMMADNVPDLIWAKNLQNEYIFVNKALCDNLLMAKDVEEPLGKTDQYFAERERATHPDDPEWYTFGDTCPDSDAIVLHNKRYQTFEEFGTIRGEFVYLDVHKAPLVDEEGNIIGTVGSARNVTRQRMLEEERFRDEQIKNVVYGISNAIRTSKDLNELYTVIRLELGYVINTNNLYIALYDKRTDKLTLPYFVDERDRFTAFPGRNTLTHYLIQQNKPMLLREDDYLALQKSGKIELVGSPAKVWLGVPLNINEELMGAIVLQNYKDPEGYTERDLELLEFIAPQISVSINQKQADDALRESEFMLREIIDNVPVMIFAKDNNQRFVLANKAFASAYGKRVGEIEGQLQAEIHPVPEEVLKFKKDDEMLLEGRSKRIETEETFTDANGDTRILRTVKVPFKPESGNGIAILGVAIDVTETKNNEIELKNAKDKAEESDKLKTAFLANMSHEIRTPMNAIVGFSELLNDPDLPDSSRREFVGLIGDNSKLLLNLIEDIIDVAKIEAKQVKIVWSTCQVNAILDELAEYYMSQLSKYPNKQIRIEVDKAYDSEDFMVITDPLRLRQVLNNLIGNAIKFTEKGHVAFGYRMNGRESLQFYVKDTGIGLAREKLDLIFERFRQAEESSTKEYGGTGLGLTISKRLVEMLGGNMWVESELHEGSTFYFTIPYRPAKEGFKTKLFRPESDKQDWSDKTVLVAEDETSNFELIKATLLRTKAKVLRAVNGREAVEICETNSKIDLVLMDIRMPVMNGYEATRLIKAEKKELPIISLTAYAMSDDRDKSFKAGCDEYVSKPFNPTDLLEKMSRYLQ